MQEEYITAEEAEKLFAFYCGGEDNIVTYEGIVGELNYDEEDEVCLTFDNGQYHKVVDLVKKRLSLVVYDWVGTESTSWKT